jgi:hypothetical protein
MKAFQKKLALFALIASSALVFIHLSSPAQAGPIVPRGHYCLQYDEGGTDCSFTSYNQCLATASGIGAECYGKTARDDAEDSGAYGRRWNEYPAGRS